MPVDKRPSFVKRKEQQRTTRAAETRATKRLKKQGRETEIEDTGAPDVADDALDEGQERDETDSDAG